MAIEVIFRLIKKYPNASLIMAGPDSGMKKRCITLSKKLGVYGNINFKGKISKNEINEG
jgi:hypothetical protein